MVLFRLEIAGIQGARSSERTRTLVFGIGRIISIGDEPIICKISELSLVSRLINWGRIALAFNRLYDSTEMGARIC